ncbi:MAG: SusC/RagA family TonB-linked outer membrane protein [Imperialibacter sp.]|uniref:SusC/RagA family TonB-linked outer membrane protein n=1 Tax=Imperialibacter sp. TaxID=2038411 RepID=UPI003A848CB2
MRKILLITFLFTATALTHVWAQDRTVSGKVVSAEDGTELPGVNVVLKGTATGTVTDIDGNYKITVPSSGGTLVFSFIGLLSQETEIGSRSVIDATMESDVKQLSEVVVTAVGIEREKKALGYAVTELKSDQIAQKSEPDALRALQGKIPGVNIIGAGGAAGQGSNITIRGASSLLGNNQPLWVVDGVPFDNTTYATGSFTSQTTTSNRSFDLDPNTIESMTVLKGAAAAALYGSRAANGVIVVTTKAGKKGTRKGMEISVNTSYSTEKVSNLPDYQTQYTQGNNFLYVDGNFGTWGAPFDLNSPAWQVRENANLIKSIDPATGRPWVAHPYDRYNNPNNTPYFPEFGSDSVLLGTYNTPKDFFQTGGVLETAVNISGGNDKANFVAGLSRMNNQGIVINNEVTRTSMNFGGNTTLDNGIFIGGSMTYVNTDLTSPPSTGLFSGGPSVTQRLLFTPPNVNVKGLPYQDANGNQAFYRPDNDNPYFLAYHAPHTSDVDRYFGNFNIGYDVFEWLNVTYKVGFNGFTDRKLEVLPRSNTAFPTGRIIKDDLRRMELDGNLLVTVSRDLSEHIGLKAIVGHNANLRTVDRQAFQGVGIIVDGINDLDNTQSVTPFGGNKSERAYQAFLADLSFSYKDYLFLNLTGRNDLTSALPKDKRSYFYGGASSSFIFTDALNISNDILNSGKIRVGVAKVGSDPSPYLTQSVLFNTNPSGPGFGNNIAFVDFPFIGTNGQTVSGGLGNGLLTPEFTTEYEIGTDLRLFKNKVGIDFTYYNRNTTDQIVAITVPSTSGFNSAVSNIGKVSNKGIEVGLDLTPVSLPNGFNWNIFASFTRNRNVVEELTEGLDEVFINGFGNSVRVVHAVGLPYGQIKGSVAARSEDGQLLVDPATGKLIQSSEEQIIGDPNPNYILGVTNSFTYKGITLNVLFDYRDGGDMWSGTYNQVYGRGLTTGTVPEGPRGREVTVVIPGVVGDPSTQSAKLDDNGNTIPNTTSLTVNDWYFINTFGSSGPEEFSVFDASTIRLREISLGYSLPKNLLSKTPFGSANISLSGRNLWFKALNFPDDLNFDPETNSLGTGNVEGLSAFQSGNAQGIDLGIIPTTRRYGVNLRFTF